MDGDCPRTLAIVLSVLGVIVAAAALLPELTIARNAAVLGEGGGNATGPPTRGVRPVDGVRPVRKDPDGSKLNNGGCIEPALAAKAAMEAAGWEVVVGCCCGPASMAGERGPARSELVMPAEENAQE